MNYLDEINIWMNYVFVEWISVTFTTPGWQTLWNKTNFKDGKMFEKIVEWSLADWGCHRIQNNG